MKLSSACALTFAPLMLLLLAACSSTPPSSHYILRALEPPPESDSGVSLGIGPVVVPDYLQRNNFVFSRDANRLQIDTLERWAEPLDEGIVRVLSINLAGMLQSQDIRPYPWHPRRLPDYAVQVRVLELEANQQQARLIAEWLLLQPATDEPLVRRMAPLQLDLSSGSAEAVAAAYSELFFRLSGQIAAAISGMRDSAGTP